MYSQAHQDTIKQDKAYHTGTGIHNIYSIQEIKLQGMHPCIERCIR